MFTSTLCLFCEPDQNIRQLNTRKYLLVLYIYISFLLDQIAPFNDVPCYVVHRISTHSALFNGELHVEIISIFLCPENMFLFADLEIINSVLGGLSRVRRCLAGPIFFPVTRQLCVLHGAPMHVRFLLLPAKLKSLVYYM